MESDRTRNEIGRFVRDGDFAVTDVALGIRPSDVIVNKNKSNW